LKVLIVFHDRGFGGIQVHCLTLMEGLVRHGDDVTFCGPFDGWLAEQCRQRGIPVEACAFRGLYDVRAHLSLARAVRRLDVDIVHGHGRRSSFYGAIAARLAGIPSVSTAHSTHAWKQLHWNTRVIAVSGAVHDSLVARGVPAERIATVRHGIPGPDGDATALRATWRRYLGLSGKDVAVVMAARFVRDKGQDVAVEALARLGRSLRNVRLLLLGHASGPWFGHVSRLAEARGLGDHVRFMGYRDDVARLLPAMDICIMPSRREALSISILEASAASVPTIGSRVGGIPEVVSDGETGLLFSCADADELAACMRLLIEDRTQRRRLGRNARVRFAEHFTLARMVSETRAAYMQAASRMRAGGVGVATVPDSRGEADAIPAANGYRSARSGGRRLP